ncbi:MAG: hypothetical protein ACLQPH_10895 [Acidimicrobiales bacterium]
MTPDSPAAVQTDASPSTPVAQAGQGGGDANIASDTSGSQVKRFGFGLFLLLLVAGIALLIVFFAAVRHWLALHTGTLHGGPDLYYNFWSGFGSDLGEATLITAVGVGVYTGVRRVNCHTKGCWRIGHHALDGTPYILCRHHHPAVPTKGASHEHILQQHRKYQEAQEKAR